MLVSESDDLNEESKASTSSPMKTSSSDIKELFSEMLRQQAISNAQMVNTVKNLQNTNQIWAPPSTQNFPTLQESEGEQSSDEEYDFEGWENGTYLILNPQLILLNLQSLKLTQHPQCNWTIPYFRAIPPSPTGILQLKLWLGLILSVTKKSPLK